MAGEVLRYTRSFVRSLRKNQRVRLTATVTPAASGVFNATSRFGEYGRLRVAGGDLFFAYSHYPTPPFEHETQATFTGTVTEGQFAWAPGGPRHCVIVFVTPEGIFSEFSTDDQKSWAAGGFTPGSHAAIACSREGMMAFGFYDAGGIGIGLQPPGDVDFPLFLPVANTVADASLLPYSFEDDSFRLAFDPRGWLWMHARIAGSGQTDLLFSNDDGTTNPGVFTFEPTSGAVTGITGGTHPGICSDDAGTLYAWARVAGKIQMSRREAGAVDWSAPAVVKDDMASDLAVGDAMFSIAPAREGTDRLVLAANLSGETLVSDHHSADAGGSFKRFL